MPHLPLSSRLTVLRGVGPAYAEALGQAGLETLRDLLWALPYRYVDRGSLRRIAELERETPDGILIVDAALMVETGGYRRFEFLIVVACDPVLQLSRLMQRSGLTEVQAKARMDSQMPIEEKKRLAHYTIDTSGTFAETREQVSAIYRDLVRHERSRKGGA